jgi:hypothetical protein
MRGWAGIVVAIVAGWPAWLYSHAAAHPPGNYPPSAFILDEPPTGGIRFPQIPNTPFDQTQGISYSANRAPYVIQYNVTVQRELFAHAVASLTYAGSHGVRLFSSVNENLPIPCSAARAPLPPWCPAMPSGAPGFAGNPFTGQLTNPNFSDLNDAAPSSTSRYNSLQASLKPAIRRGVSGAGGVLMVQMYRRWLLDLSTRKFLRDHGSLRPGAGSGAVCV